MTKEKQKLKSSNETPKFRHALVLLLSLCLSGCVAGSNPAFPDPDPKAAEQIEPCLKKGAELQDWLDRIYKLKDQLQ